MSQFLTYDDEPRKYLRHGRVASWLWYNDELSDVRSVDLTPDGAWVAFLYRQHSASPKSLWVWRSVRVDIPKALVLDSSMLPSLLQREPVKLAFRASSMAKVAFMLSNKPRAKDSLYSRIRVVLNREELDRGEVQEFIENWESYVMDWGWRE
jgi:hypothetical protein